MYKCSTFLTTEINSAVCNSYSILHVTLQSYRLSEKQLYVLGRSFQFDIVLFVFRSVVKAKAVSFLAEVCKKCPLGLLSGALPMIVRVQPCSARTQDYADKSSYIAIRCAISKGLGYNEVSPVYRPIRTQ